MDSNNKEGSEKISEPASIQSMMTELDKQKNLRKLEKNKKILAKISKKIRWFIFIFNIDWSWLMNSVIIIVLYFINIVMILKHFLDTFLKTVPRTHANFYKSFDNTRKLFIHHPIQASKSSSNLTSITA